MDLARHEPAADPRPGPSSRPPEELRQGAVTLRRWRADDTDLAFRLVSESQEYLRPWMPWADSYSLDAARQYLKGCERDWAAGAAFNYLVSSDGTPAGSAGLMARIGPGGLEIGYWVHPDHAGQGIATAAAAVLTEAAFALPGTSRVEILHDLNNGASGQVPRKLGFARVATSPARFPLAPSDSGTSVQWRLVRPPG